jgi:hypothetical protein
LNVLPLKQITLRPVEYIFGNWKERRGDSRKKRSSCASYYQWDKDRMQLLVILVIMI